MSTPVFYALLVGILVIIILIVVQHRRKKEVKPFKKVSRHYELVALKKMPQIITENNWCVIIKSFEALILVFEDNDLGKIGYHIYSNYKEQLIQGQMFVYIKDNKEDRYLKIVTDGSSESMIGINHPDSGHIGYLSFEEVEY